MSDLGLEPWQQMFHERWSRDAARRLASMPDSEDMSLYDGYEREDDE
jgi:hypothetical protein